MNQAQPAPDYFAVIERSAAVIARCTIYRSRTPMRVVYQSAADADAHAEGFDGYPAMPEDVGYTPRMAGYYEAERSDQMRDEERADQSRAERSL